MSYNISPFAVKIKDLKYFHIWSCLKTNYSSSLHFYTCYYCIKIKLIMAVILLRSLIIFDENQWSSRDQVGKTFFFGVDRLNSDDDQ